MPICVYGIKNIDWTSTTCNKHTNDKTATKNTYCSKEMLPCISALVKSVRLQLLPKINCLFRHRNNFCVNVSELIFNKVTTKAL